MRPLRREDPHSAGPIRILARLGAGGAATVYYGHTRGGRPTAVKVMHREFADHDTHRDRFRREVEFATRAGGAYTPAVLDHDLEASPPWVAWEYLPCLSLREAVDRFGALPPETVRTLAAGLAEALSAIHTAGIVHLDITPGNVLLTEEGPRVIDFGIARDSSETDVPAGSHGYMSPEMENGENVGPAGDVYSLGMTLVHAATAQRDAAAVTDPVLAPLLARCLHHDPARRPALSEIAENVAVDDAPALPPRLRSQIFSESQPPPTRELTRRGLLVSVGAVLAVALVAAGVLLPTVYDQQRGAAAGEDHDAGPGPASGLRHVTLEVAGDARISQISFEVGDETVEKKDVSLPWTAEADIPASDGTVPWEMKCHFEGDMEYQLSVDGFEVNQGTSQAVGSGDDSSAHGEL